MQNEAGPRGKTALTFELTFTVVRFLDGVETEGKRISLVTMTARCFFTWRNLRERSLGIVSAGIQPGLYGYSFVIAVHYAPKEKIMAARIAPPRPDLAAHREALSLLVHQNGEGCIP
jgi:hypothetical protein